MLMAIILETDDEQVGGLEVNDSLTYGIVAFAYKTYEDYTLFFKS